MFTSMIDFLLERIERNYEDFKAIALAELTKQEIFEFAGHISAIEDVRFFLNTHDWLDEGEAGYLLSLDDPLEVLADEWEDFLTDSGCGFCQALEPLLERNSGGDPDEDGDDFDDFDDYD